MMDDLVATFMPRFTAIATKRIMRSIELATNRDPNDVPAIARELHAIAGEAGLLGVVTVVTLARAGEERARQLRTGGSESDAAALLASLTELKHAIEAVTPPNQKGPHE